MKDTDILRYDRMVESALRGVVRQAIEEVIGEVGENDRLPGDHHFYITFMTGFPGVKIPDYLKESYPGEMTIVLQYQFDDLAIIDDNNGGRIAVTLSFNSVPERLEVPLNAISIFADPSVSFALQFQPLGDDDDGPDLDPGEDFDDDNASGKRAGEKTGEVVSLDKFRKKD